MYYAKFLKYEYNVIAVAISGTTTAKMKVDTFYWQKGQKNYTALKKARDIILEPKNYIELIKGNKLQKAYSLDEIRNTAINMHNNLREIKVTEAHKLIFIAGILIALNDNDFIKTYDSLLSYKYIAMFIVTVLNCENYRYSYGRKFNQDNIRNTIIKLPAMLTSENTYISDWQFMEDYINSLPYSDRIYNVF